MTDWAGFDSISDDELHVRVRRLTARANVTLADLLAHLGEVEARGIHRNRACASLYTYCIYELRMSEDAAFRRAKAARLVREYPELHAMVAKGELHLTGLLMIAPLLGGERHAEVLVRARFRSKREISRLIARMDPKPPVPVSVEPLGPAPGRATYSAFIESLCGPVRELPVGDGPEDWIEHGAGDDEGPDCEEAGDCELSGENESSSSPEPIDQSERPLHYKVQFTASQEYVDLVNEAFDLLGCDLKLKDLPEVHVLAMRELVRQLKKRKRAATDRPRTKHREEWEAEHAAPARREHVEPAQETAARGEHVQPERGEHVQPERGEHVQPERETASAAPARVEDAETRDMQSTAPARVETATAKRENTAPGRERDGAAPAPQERQVVPSSRGRRNRRIPAAVARAVWARDGQRCAYVDERGRRCRETRGLELHHREAHARGGPATEENLEPRCRAHNLLAAELDFGREHMDRKRGAA